MINTHSIWETQSSFTRSVWNMDFTLKASLTVCTPTTNFFLKSLCVSITLKHWNGAQLFIAYWINFNKLFERCYDLKFKYWMNSNVDMATSYYKSDILHKRPYFPIARKSFSNLNRIITVFTIHTILFLSQKKYLYFTQVPLLVLNLSGVQSVDNLQATKLK